MTEPPADRAAHRVWLTGAPTGELGRGLVVDLGCGRGDDLRLLAARHSRSEVRFVGVDASAEAVAGTAAALVTDRESRFFRTRIEKDQDLILRETV